MNRPASFRLQQIWLAFRDAKPGTVIKAADLAAQLEVCRKTIHRDIDELRRWGCVVATNRDGFSFQGFKMVHQCCPWCGQVNPPTS